MKIVFLYHLIMVFLSIIHCKHLADNQNNSFFNDKDIAKYLPPKRRKVSSWFQKQTKNRPIKFNEYWSLRLAEVILIIDVIMLSGFRIITKSYCFMDNWLFFIYTIFLVILPILFEDCVNIYISVKKASDEKRSRDEEQQKKQ